MIGDARLNPSRDKLFFLKLNMNIIIQGHTLNWYNPVAVTDWVDANSCFLGLVSVGQHDY